MAKQPMIGPGNFQWSTGGWFGAQAGSTVWMLIAAAWIAPLAPEVSIVGLLCFTIPNTLGSWLWRRRDRIAPHPAIQVLMLSISASSLLLLLTLDWFWPAALPRESLWPGYAVCVGMPVVMARWYVTERYAVKQRSQADHADPGASSGQF